MSVRITLCRIQNISNYLYVSVTVYRSDIKYVLFAIGSWLSCGILQYRIHDCGEVVSCNKNRLSFTLYNYPNVCEYM